MEWYFLQVDIIFFAFLRQSSIFQVPFILPMGSGGAEK